MEHLQTPKNISDYLNENLSGVATWFKSMMGLSTSSLPAILQAPLNFTLFSITSFYLLISNINALMCNAAAVIYPIMYCEYLLTMNQMPENNVAAVVKYWIIFGSLTLVDPIFSYVPLYYYLKLVFIYFLIKNDFALTPRVYAMFEKLYAQLEESSKQEEGIWQKLLAKNAPVPVAPTEKKKNVVVLVGPIEEEKDAVVLFAPTKEEKKIN